MKILAIDPGRRRIGLATCDELQLTTRLLPVFQVRKGSSPLGYLLQLLKEEGFERIILGLPYNMDGSEGEAAKLSRRLAGQLEAQLKAADMACQVILWDERLTSFEAEQRLRKKGISKAKAKDYLDSIAAEVLLQDYLATLQKKQ